MLASNGRYKESIIALQSACQEPNVAREAEFVAEINSTLEPIVVERICKPVLRRIPERVHPNTISLFNHLVCWVTALLAYLSTRLSPLGRLLALSGASVGMFVSMVADCLDGMQARRTNRCSKLGQVLDHSLDAIHVPLVTFGITLALQLDPWAVAVVHVTNVMIYNGQLVLQHYTGRFVHPKTSGTDAECGVSIGYVAMGLLFFFFDRRAPWVEVVVLVAALLAILIQVKLNLFYYVRLRRHVVHHLPFVLICAGFAALYLVGSIDTMAFLLSIVFVSFRISGGYVLHTVVGRRFGGFDVWVVVLIAAIAAAHLWLEPIRSAGVPVQAALPYVGCLYMAGRGILDIVRNLPLLV